MGTATSYRWIIFLLLGAFLAMVGCKRSTEPSAKESPENKPHLFSSQALPTETIPLAGQAFQVELAYTRMSRIRGLMFRRELPHRRGMLFIFPVSEPRTFHMRNCLIDLDLLYLDEDGQIVRVYRMKASLHNEPTQMYPSEEPIRYALELPAGTIDSLNLQRGESISLPRRVRSIIPEAD